MHDTRVRKKKMENEGLKGWQWFFFFFFWSQFIFLWAKRSLPQGWCKAAFSGSRIHHTKEKRRHRGDSMINTWFRDPVIACPEMRIRIYLSPWSLGSGSNNILSKVCFKTPTVVIGEDIRYIDYMMLCPTLKRFIDLSSNLGHTCNLFVMVIACFAECLPLTQSHRSMSGQVRSPARDSMNPLIKVRLSKLKVGSRFFHQTDFSLSFISKLNVVWPQLTSPREASKPSRVKWS